MNKKSEYLHAALKEFALRYRLRDESPAWRVVVLRGTQQKPLFWGIPVSQPTIIEDARNLKWKRQIVMIYGIRDLRYYFMEDEAHWLDNFQVLDSRRLVWNEAEIVMYALCTSHAVSVHWQGKQYTELLSCMGPLKISPALAEMSTCGPFEISKRFECLQYRFQLTFQELHGNDALVETFDSENEIAVSYPRIPGLDTPVTRIGWRNEPGILRIETLHTYPEAARGVRSQSTFEIAREARV